MIKHRRSFPNSAEKGSHARDIPVGNEVRINEVRNDRARGARVDVAVRN